LDKIWAKRKICHQGQRGEEVSGLVNPGERVGRNGTPKSFMTYWAKRKKKRRGLKGGRKPQTRGFKTKRGSCQIKPDRWNRMPLRGVRADEEKGEFNTSPCGKRRVRTHDRRRSRTGREKVGEKEAIRGRRGRPGN